MKIYGIGINDLKYSAHLRSYKTWCGILERCYKNGYNISDNWKFFSNFKIWYDMNYPKHLVNKGIVIDLVNIEFNKKIKFFSEETCMFLPRPVLFFFTKKVKEATGIYKNKNRFTARIKEFDTKKVKTKTFDTKEEASCFYNLKKKNEIKKIFEYLKQLNYSDEEIKKIKEKEL